MVGLRSDVGMVGLRSDVGMVGLRSDVGTVGRFGLRGRRAVAASLAVDVWEHEGRIFEVVMASDVVRDGMVLELTDLASPESSPALEAFWHDDGNGFDFIAHQAGTLPFIVVERFVAAARKSLPPG